MCYYELKVVPQLHLVIIHVPCIINNYPAVYMQFTSYNKQKYIESTFIMRGGGIKRSISGTHCTHSKTYGFDTLALYIR